ncbi:Ig-like domain-containing protein [Flavobacterium sp.]|uniref:Ig-like domain-containing protein n=1 Tax=Flavobacterium sp. TaxID=239 RepID=UPI00262235F7|nr:Ig-like domain-containing protein [Flavobacterium sp.]
MKNLKINYLKFSFLLALLMLTNISCERDLSDDASLSTFSKNPDVFIDGFSAGLGYGAFGGSKLTAFSVDTDTKYQGTSSMRFDVPNEGDADGGYAGGVFIDGAGRNLTDYDALTFWVKGSKGAYLNEVGYGNDFGLNKYNVTLRNVSITTNWQKVIIPIPNASKLVQEKGMFWYAEGPEGGLGYTFWIDNVKYEKLGTIAPGQASIQNGINQTTTTFVGINTPVANVATTFNMPNGSNQTVTISPAYLEFNSSNPSVASVDSNGVVTSLSAGTTVITATFGGVPANGSLTINCVGTFVNAPTPTRSPSNVISIFSDAYANVPVNYYNGYWQPFQTTVSNDFNVLGDNILNYTNFNFVGIEFSSPTVNATSKTHIHLDAFIPGPIAPGRQLRVIVVDFGANGVFGGGDDTRHSTTFTAPFLVSQSWRSIDIPFSAMPGLLSRSNLAQIILEGGDNSVIYVDNIYFYNN